MKSDQLQIINRQFKACGTFLFDEYVVDRDYLHLQGGHEFSDNRLSLIELRKNPSEIIVDVSGLQGFTIFTMKKNLFAQMAYFPSMSGKMRFIPHEPKLLLFPNELSISPHDVHYLMPVIVEADVQQRSEKKEGNGDQGSGFLLVNPSKYELLLINELSNEYMNSSQVELIESFKGHAKLGFARVRRQGIDQIALHRALIAKYSYSPFTLEEKDGIIIISIVDFNWPTP